MTPDGTTAARIAALSGEQRALLERRARALGLGHLLQADTPAIAAVESQMPVTTARCAPSFSLFFFSAAGDSVSEGKYDLLRQCAAFADQNGLAAVWTPERHFHPFGGLYPNPATLGAALATMTTRLAIRAGSIVVPLHHPARIAEEWSVVDNLSAGRAGVAFACGWRPEDFVLSRVSHADRKEAAIKAIEAVRSLWRGDAVTFETPDGGAHAIRSFPRPIQPELPAWLAVAGNPDSWRLAGQMGLNVLTMLGMQTIDGLAAKTRIYDANLAAYGHDRRHHVVTVVMHAFLGQDECAVREHVRAPLERYLAAFLSQSQAPEDPILAAQSAACGPDTICNAAFDWYFDRAGLFGPPARCVGLVRRLAQIGADEIACLIDFGCEPSAILASLPYLKDLERACRDSGEAHA